MGLEIRIFCYDSSIQPCQLIDLKEKVHYKHFPGLRLGEKLQKAASDLQNLTNFNGWVLLSTDDDLFMPTIGLCEAIKSHKWQSHPATIPCRYIFFKRDAYREMYVRFVEQWKHHIHIPKANLGPLERITWYASQGVACHWGFFNYAAFTKVAKIWALEVNEDLLPRNCQGIIEDALNLLILSFDWIGINSHSICLRGYDRDFGANPFWRPSWVILPELKDHKELAPIYKEFKRLLGFELVGIIDRRFLSNHFLEQLLSNHVNGYKNMNSRLYAGSPALLLSAPEHRKYSYPAALAADKEKQHIEVVLPVDPENINHLLYPADSLLADADVIKLLYKYYDYFCITRTLRSEESIL